MKKIVALVLAMVMVLGLATTAFGAINYGDAAKENYYDGMNKGAGVVTYYPASEYVPGAQNYLAHIVDADDNLRFVGGPVNLYNAKGVKVDLTMGKKVATDTDFVYNYEAKTFGEQKWSCYQDGVKADYTYVDENGDTHYANKAKGAAEPTTYLLVGGKVVAAVNVDATVIPGMHVLAVETGVGPVEVGVGVYTAYCVACKKDIKISYTNVNDAGYLYELDQNVLEFLDKKTAALPAGYEFLTDTVYVLDAAPSAGANGSTVESAKTFDAGIAMYVGMSVMAAAGSAVVLKKKD